MKKIALKRLIIQGISYRRTIQFNEDFTIISGDKTSGKSLILSLIDYCLGKSQRINLTVQPELDEKCNQVFLELKINGEILTLNRLLKEKQSKISIYFCEFENLDVYTPKTLDVKDAMKVLMEKLGVNEYKIIRHKPHSKEKEIENVSFRDIFRYVYINQHELGTGDFLGAKNPFIKNKNVHAFKMIFNLIDADKDALNEQLVQVKNDIQVTQKEISGLNSYLKDLDEEDPIALQAKSDKFYKKIEKQKVDKENVIKNNQAKDKQSNENKMYITLKNDLNTISNELSDYHNKKRDLEMSINSKRLLLKDYEKERQEVQETLEINYKLIIPEQSTDCPLCKSRVSNHQHGGVRTGSSTERTLQKIHREIDNKINLVTRLINRELRVIEEFDKQTSHLYKKQTMLSKAIDEYSKDVEVPFLSQIDSINIIINNMNIEHGKVKESLRIHNKIEEKNNHIKDLKASEIRLESGLKKLQIKDEDRKSLFEFLDENYKGFMKRLKYDVLGDTYIHQEQFIPLYNGGSVYSHESGGLLESMQLSYLGAILKSKTEGYAADHPGFLMLDSLSKYLGTLSSEDPIQIEEGKDTEKQKQSKIERSKITDPEVYKEFYNILIELSKEHQIILVENTPPEKFNKYIKYIFFEGQRGLVDVEVNELDINK